MRNGFRKTCLAAAMAVSALLLGGCINLESELFVKKDGSGQITVTKNINPMMAGMMGGGEDGEDSKLEEAEAEAEALAARIPGGEVVSVDDLGGGKMRIVVGFPDVNGLDPKVLSSTTNIGESEGDDEDYGSTFRFAGGVLTYTNKNPKDTEKLGEMGDQFGDEEQRENLQMFLPMLEGAGLSLTIRVDGPIAETNARHADGSVVTLVSLPLGAFISAAINKSDEFKAIGQATAGDPDAFAQAIEDLVPGLKMDPQEEIRIRF